MATREAIQVPQPGGEAIELNNDYGRLDRYEYIKEQLARPVHDLDVPDHIVAHVVTNAPSEKIDNDELVEITKEFNRADLIFRGEDFGPHAPVIYRLHCEDAVAVTGDMPNGIQLVRDRPIDNPGWVFSHSVIKTDRHFRLWNHQDETTAEDAELKMHAPLHTLAGDLVVGLQPGEDDKVQQFADHDAEWMRYPVGKLIVGKTAVDAFLAVQAETDLTKGRNVNQEATYRVVHSWAMLAAAGLKRIGYDAPIGKPGDLVHATGVESVATLAASALGSGVALPHHYRPEEQLMRNLSGVEFEPADVQAASEQAAERLYASEKRVNRFGGVLLSDRTATESHLTVVAGNIVDKLAEMRTGKAA
jgi:hypothetical protein